MKLMPPTAVSASSRKAYEKAGGTTRRDLFAEGEDGIFIDNTQLLDTLVAEKLEKTIQSFLTEGWKWAEVLPVLGYETRLKLKRLKPSEGPLPPKLQKEYDELLAELEK